MTYLMRVVCAWCGEEKEPTEASRPGQVSHGICSDCQKEYFPELMGTYKDQIREAEGEGI